VNEPASGRRPIVLDLRIVRQPLTGVGRYLTQLAAFLAADPAAADLTFLTLIRAGEAPVSPLPARIAPRPAGGSLPLTVSQQLILPAAVMRFPYALYHYPNFDVPVLLRGPVVATCHDLEPLRHPELFSSPIVWFYRLFAQGLRRASHVITVSASTAHDVEQLLGIPPDRITPIHHGVDDRFTPAADDEKARCRAVYDLPATYVCYVGNTMPHKNLPRLIEAMALVVRHRPDASLMLVGAPDKYRPAVEAAVERFGLQRAVRFLGRVPEADLPAIMSAAAVFAFPSLYEGFGLPVLEAMACGTPVVTSTRASLPEVVGDAAATVDPLDSSGLAEQILRLIEDPGEAARLREAGLRRARAFTWRRCALEHLAVYRKVLGAAGR
jgi:glycosyltransferase involved in cell wall biosynthesis